MPRTQIVCGHKPDAAVDSDFPPAVTLLENHNVGAAGDGSEAAVILARAGAQMNVLLIRRNNHAELVGVDAAAGGDETGEKIAGLAADGNIVPVTSTVENDAWRAVVILAEHLGGCAGLAAEVQVARMGDIADCAGCIRRNEQVILPHPAIAAVRCFHLIKAVAVSAHGHPRSLVVCTQNGGTGSRGGAQVDIRRTEHNAVTAGIRLRCDTQQEQKQQRQPCEQLPFFHSFSSFPHIMEIPVPLRKKRIAKT